MKIATGCMHSAVSVKKYTVPPGSRRRQKKMPSYIQVEADGGRRAPWEGQLQGKGTSGSRAWWVLVKGRLDSPWEPHEEEELVAFIDAGKPTGEGKELAWPRHGRDEKWTWNRLQVTAVRHPPPHPHLIGVYAHTIDNCWQHTTRPRKGSAPRIAPGTRRGHDQEWTLLGGVEGKEGHPTKEFEIHVDCQPRKPVVFMYSDGEITLLYQKVQYIIMTKWEFNDRVMMMLLSKRYFNKVYFHHSHGEGALHDRDHAHKVQKEKADLADRVRCLGKLLDSNASLDLQAFVCKTVMGMMSGEVDEDGDLCTLALDSLVKLLKKNNLFIATYATAALVNLSKDRPVVKGILLGMHIADLCMKNLDTRDEDLMVYTLMLVAHLTKAGLGNGGREACRVPRAESALGIISRALLAAHVGAARLRLRAAAGEQARYYRSDSNSDAVMYIYPKRAQNFLIVTTDLEENQYDDTNTVLVYALISRQEREAFEREGVLPQRKVAWTVLAIDKGKGHAATLTIDVLGAAGAGAQKADHAVTLRVTVDQGGQLKAKDAKGARGKKDEKDARSENRAKDSWQDTVEGDYVSMKKTEFVFEKKGLKRKEQVYIKALDGPRWWCIGNKLREMDPSCSVNHDYEVPQREYDAPSHPDVVAHNWIDPATLC
ncbi:unnamed protein product [Prorocentrum cordatum]|uniref:Uncharacterized protein n=1 Tax=Prorocentrum cordatum TaxID=2364126 RepID=A0ABN9WW21_9DINO|nr:unnamed protein product [Polarella glacialis]